jgi:hypothetical protein
MPPTVVAVRWGPVRYRAHASACVRIWSTAGAAYGIILHFLTRNTDLAVACVEDIGRVRALQPRRVGDAVI